MQTPRQITTVEVGRLAVIQLCGELDLATNDDLQRAITAAGGTGPDRTVYVDLSETTFIDAAAIGAIVRAGQALTQQGCRLKLFGARGLVLELLALTEVLDYYAVADSLPDPSHMRP